MLSVSLACTTIVVIVIAIHRQHPPQKQIQGVRLFDLVFSFQPATTSIKSSLHSFSNHTLRHTHTDHTTFYHTSHTSPRLSCPTNKHPPLTPSATLKQAHDLYTSLQRLDNGCHYPAQGPLPPPPIFFVHCLVSSWAGRQSLTNRQS
jgi:hypothetical protein